MVNWLRLRAVPWVRSGQVVVVGIESFCSGWYRMRGVSDLQPESDRSVVRQAYLHVGAKAAGGDVRDHA